MALLNTKSVAHALAWIPHFTNIVWSDQVEALGGEAFGGDASPMETSVPSFGIVHLSLIGSSGI